MFSKGQIIFSIIFFISFVIAIFYSYRKDIIVHQRIYKGSYKILIGFILFILLLFVIKIFFKH
ncbi:MAG: hypothetical protein EBR38_02590 [Flavobacteriaceae bacterium]|nr:hypothetical protein [Flavobacteriaceae bacterium]